MAMNLEFGICRIKPNWQIRIPKCCTKETSCDDLEPPVGVGHTQDDNDDERRNQAVA
jgi:hypothetical protein